MPEFMPIWSRMGPFTTTILAKEVVEVKSEVTPVDAMAKITGKYSGFAPAMTALIATFSTVYSHASWGGRWAHLGHHLIGSVTCSLEHLGNLLLRGKYDRKTIRPPILEEELLQILWGIRPDQPRLVWVFL